MTHVASVFAPKVRTNDINFPHCVSTTCRFYYVCTNCWHHCVCTNDWHHNVIYMPADNLHKKCLVSAKFVLIIKHNKKFVFVALHPKSTAIVMA